MKIISGTYADAVIYTDNLEETASQQIKELCNQPFVEGCKIRIMPDVHAGKGCVIGFTADLGDKVIPNIVGVDISCGVITVELGKVDINMQQLDTIIRKHIPSGHQVHEGRKVYFPQLQQLHCFRDLKDTKRIERSIGTLGGGNHFIEVNVDSDNNKYLVIHSGSRNLGKQVAEIYQNLAIDLCSGKEDYFKQRDELIDSYKKVGKRKAIQQELKKLKRQYDGLEAAFPRYLCYLTGQYRKKYLHDMEICQQYADLNRKTMADVIVTHLFSKDLEEFEHFQTIHNYISFGDNIIRKGAISAHKGEKVLMPINMRDGSIIAIGKGNAEWNNSAPHGAGRLMSRGMARERVTLDEFQESMKGIWTTSVRESTIDESPMAYKSINEILGNIHETADVIDVIKPIYNFKAN